MQDAAHGVQGRGGRQRGNHVLGCLFQRLGIANRDRPAPSHRADRSTEKASDRGRAAAAQPACPPPARSSHRTSRRKGRRESRPWASAAPCSARADDWARTQSSAVIMTFKRAEQRSAWASVRPGRERFRPSRIAAARWTVTGSFPSGSATCVSMRAVGDRLVAVGDRASHVQRLARQEGRRAASRVS